MNDYAKGDILLSRHRKRYYLIVDVIAGGYVGYDCCVKVIDDSGSIRVYAVTKVFTDLMTKVVSVNDS